ncbi:hypothetical protein [Microcoleus sp. S13C4]
MIVVAGCPKLPDRGNRQKTCFLQQIIQTGEESAAKIARIIG